MTYVLFIILAYFFVQKFRCCIFLTVLLGRLLPLTLGFTCGSLNSTLSPPNPYNQAVYNAPGQQDPINAHIEQPITPATLDIRKYYTPYPYSYKTPPLDTRKKAIPGNKVIPENDAVASSDLSANTLQNAIPWPNSTAYRTISLSKPKMAPPTKPVLCLKQSEPLDAWPISPSLPDKNDRAIKNKAIYHQPTSLQSEPKSLWEELQDADNVFFSQAFLHNSNLPQPLEGSILANMEQEADALYKALNSVKEFEISQKKLQDSITNTNILLSNNGLSKAIKLVNNDEIQSPLSSAIEAISALQAALKEENAQPRITESGLASLNKKRSNILNILPKLQKVIDEECEKVLFIEKSLMLLTENLSKACDLLFGLLTVDDMDNMTEAVKKRLISNKTQLKEVGNILKRLEDLQSSQQKMARSFRKEIWETQDRLVGIQKKIITLLKNPLKEVERKMKLLDLREVRLEANIIKRKVENPKRMESIIMGLELSQEELEEVQTILSKIDFKSLKTKITKEATETVKKILELSNNFQRSIQETAESIINQTKSLQIVLTEVDPCYDSGYEEE